MICGWPYLVMDDIDRELAVGLLTEDCMNASQHHPCCIGTICRMLRGNLSNDRKKSKVCNFFTILDLAKSVDRPASLKSAVDDRPGNNDRPADPDDKDGDRDHDLNGDRPTNGISCFLVRVATSARRRNEDSL